MSNASPPSRRKTGANDLARASGARRRSSPEALRPEGAKLVCIAGPSMGTEFPLLDVEVIIGRASENEVSIPDSSVSRRHAKVRRQGHAWVCADLGSGNGTWVNGHNIEAEQVLRDGDVITLGDTELSFLQQEPTDAGEISPRVSSGGRRAPRESLNRSGASDIRARVSRSRDAEEDPLARKRSRRLMVLASLLVVVGLGVFAVVKAQLRQRQERAQREAIAMEAQRAKLAALFQTGKNLVRDGKWEEAKVHFLEVKSLAPDYPSVDQFLERASKEIPNEQALARAQSALGRGALAEASMALGLVSPDTQLFESQQTLTRALDERIVQTLRDAQRLLQLLPSGQGGQAKLQGLRASLQDVLTARPGSRDAATLLSDVESRLKGLEAPKKSRRHSSSTKAWDAPISIYLDADLPGAIAAAEACSRSQRRCAQLLKNLRAFAELHGKVEKLDAAGLSKLLSLDRAITGGQRSLLARNAETRAGTLLYKSASAAMAAGQWAKAVEYAKRTVEADPSHSGAKALLEEVRGKAKDIYLLGYSMKDGQPDEALKRFREVLQMTPRGDEYNTKAANWIRQLER